MQHRGGSGGIRIRSQGIGRLMHDAEPLFEPGPVRLRTNPSEDRSRDSPKPTGRGHL